ncbi:MAG: PAS domain S-box protein [Acidobacteriota bacterium]|nr:PAS domain S-box protein [Acidobacteriota bacterium]
MAEKKSSAPPQRASALAVAEQVTAALSVRDADSKFQAVAETAPCAIFIYREDNFVYGNPAAEVITGYSLPELYQIRFYDLVHPEFRKYIIERAAARQRGELETSRYELRILPKDGSERWVDLTAKLINFDGQPSVLGIAFDITERKQAEQLQQALYRIAETASSAEDLPAFYASIHKILGELMYARNCYIAVYDAAKDSLSFPYFVDEFDPMPAPRPLGKGLTDYVIRTGKPLLVTPETFQQLHNRGEITLVGTFSQDWMGVPLKSGDSTYGALVIQSYEQQQRFGAREQAVFTFVSQQLAGAIEQKRNQEALRESEEWHRLAFERNLAGVYRSTIEGHLLDCNLAFARIFGYESREAMLGHSTNELFFDPKERDRLMETLLRAGSLTAFEIKLKRKDGAPVWCLENMNVVKSPDGRSAVLEGTMVDITERKAVESNLQVQKAYLEQLFESAPEAIVVLDNDANVIRVNREFVRTFGYTAEEALGKRIDELIVPPELFAEATEVSNRVLRGRMAALDTRRRRKDGSMVEVSILGTPINVGGGQVAVYAIYRDITEQKQAERALAQSEQRFRSLIQSSSDVIVVLDPDGTVHYASPSTERQIGALPEMLSAKNVFDFIHPEDRAAALQAFELGLHDPEGSPAVELRVRHADGSWRTFECVSNRLLEGEKVTGLIVNARNITERRHADRLQSALYRIAETASSAEDLDALYPKIHAILSELMYARNCYIALADAATGMVSFPYFVDEVDPPPQPRKGRRALTEYVLRSGQPLLATPEMLEELVQRGDVDRVGAPSLDWMGVPLKNGDTTFGVLALQTYEPNIRYGEQEKEILTFVSRRIASAIESRRSQDAMRESEAKFRAVAESAGTGIYIHNAERFLYVNRATEQISGYSREEFMQMHPFDLVHPEFRAVLKQRAAARLRGEDAPSAYEFKMVTKSGEERWLDFSAGTVMFGGERAILATAVDISERKRAEALQAALYRIADKASTVGDLSELYREIHRIVGELMYAGNFYIALHDAASHTITFPYAVDEIDDFPEPTASVPAGQGLTEYVLRTGQPLLATPEVFHALLRRGEVQAVGVDSVDWLGVPLKNGAHTFGVLVLQSYDDKVRFTEKDKEILTFVSQNVASAIEHKRNQEALRISEARYRSQVQSAVYGIYRSSVEDRFLDVNPALVQMLGYGSTGELLGVSLARDVYDDPEDRMRLIREYAASTTVDSEQVRWKKKDGTSIIVRLSGRAILSPQGVAEAFEMIAEDVTERQGLEEQLRQSQKMEAVGRLAGGVAHDFNNLLTVIKGYSELMLDQLSPADPMRAEVEEVERAADRAAALTRQLLAFSRQQVLAPKVIDLNAVVSNMDKLLKRLLGEDIDLFAVLDQKIGSVRADPGQIEQVIMNLAVNARDAMPKGGKLTVETVNVTLDEGYAREHATVKPGNYVMLAVSDSGVGMDQVTLSHVFEPFFTTKESGKGTGLGLSTVYGIVKQSGGYIWAYSEIGIGTSFKVYLPRVDAAAEIIRPAIAADPHRGHETVLLVEDEDGVRALIRQVLHRSGYTVLQAREGGEALLLCERHDGKIALLLTDVVLTQMSGTELAQRLLGIRPEMRVLYMSGYTDEAIVHHGVLTAGSSFLQKPFTNESLARKVREVIDAPPATRSAKA